MGPSGPRVLKFDGAFGPEGCGIALTGDEYEVDVTYLPSSLPSGGLISTDEIHQYWLMCTFVVYICFVAYKVCTDIAHIWSGSYQLR